MKRRDLLMSAVALAGCAGGRKKRVAVIPKATSHLFWVSVQAGALAAGKRFGLEILWNGAPTETDYSRQIQILDSMVAQRVDGIAIAATERNSLVGPIDRAIAAGIPVTVFDSGIDSDNYTSFIATDNYGAGKMGGRKLAELLGGKGKVAVIMHAPGSLSTMEREKGFRDVIAADFPRIKIVAEQFGMSDRARARAAAENILAAQPDLDGFFASTEPSSAGIALALKAREMGGKVKFVAFDSSDSMLDDLRGGTIHAIVVQDPFKLGFEAVHSIQVKLTGGTPQKKVDLPARVITKEDLEKPEIKELLHPDVKKYL